MLALFFLIRLLLLHQTGFGSAVFFDCCVVVDFTVYFYAFLCFYKGKDSFGGLNPEVSPKYAHALTLETARSAFAKLWVTTQKWVAKLSQVGRHSFS